MSNETPAAAAKNTRTPSARQAAWKGMNWITQKRRLAIYLRDGLACAYCSAGVESGAQLTLDHVKPDVRGGSNHESNLITCCHRCNSARGSRSVRRFAADVAAYLGDTSAAADIELRLRRNPRRVLKPFLVEAADMIARRGSAKRALDAMI